MSHNDFPQSYLFLRHLVTELRFLHYVIELPEGKTVRDLARNELVKICSSMHSCRVIGRLIERFNAETETPDMQDKDVFCIAVRFPDGSKLLIKNKKCGDLGERVFIEDLYPVRISEEGVVTTEHIPMDLSQVQENWIRRRQNWLKRIARLARLSARP